MRMLVILMIVVALSATGTAAITVGNPGFEDVSIAPGGYSYEYTPWVSFNEGGGYTPWLSNGYYSPEMGTNIMYTTHDNVYQVLTETFVEGVTYQFSMRIGLGHNGASNGEAWTLYFFDGDATLNSVADLTAAILGSASGVATDSTAGTVFSVAYTATAADAGKKIGIGFDGDYYTQFDDAAVSIVPEPATMVLLGLGSLVLARRRK